MTGRGFAPAAATALAAAVAGCGGAHHAAPRPACATPPPGDHTLRLTSDGLPRVALLHVPRAARPGRRLPLVVALSGAGGTGPGFARESGYSAQADRSGFLVAYPTAYGRRPFWNMNGHVPGKPDDVAFVAALLDRVAGAACVDRARVYATGVSNGGGLAARLACELPGRLAAVAPVAGGYGSLPACHPSRPVAVLEIHGTGDRVVPYEGRPPDRAGSVRRWLAMWRRIDHCHGRAWHADEPGVERFAWTACAEHTAVEHVRLAGIRHGWPGPGVPEAPVSAARETWDFFTRHTREP